MICAYEECNNEFEPKTHNQKYCSDECCRTATNKKLKEAYYERKARLAGAKRICSTRGCNVELSRYSESKVCGKCESAPREKQKRELLEMVTSVVGKTGKR